ncbi:MAG: hypothetical protein LBP55_01160 [Candidatus Adiutrix sp.]|jgi:hypothetical protein|nr:hypothetical protein [Candidatus Adiutrix sp.]
MPESHRIACINLSRDICLRLVERRSLAPEQLTEAMNFLTVSAENLFHDLGAPKGLYLVRLARDFTLKLIERNLIGNVQAAASSLVEYGQMAADISAQLDPALAQVALNTARDLTLKLLETGRLSRPSLPALFEKLAHTVVGEKVGN